MRCRLLWRTFLIIAVKVVGTEELSMKATFRGTGVSSGAVVGHTFRVDRIGFSMPDRKISRKDIPAEMERLHRAVELSKSQIRDASENLKETLGASQTDLFEGYILLIGDPTLSDLVRRTMERELIGVEKAFLLRLIPLPPRWLS